MTLIIYKNVKYKNNLIVLRNLFTYVIIYLIIIHCLIKIITTTIII